AESGRARLGDLLVAHLLEDDLASFVGCREGRSGRTEVECLGHKLRGRFDAAPGKDVADRQLGKLGDHFAVTAPAGWNGDLDLALEQKRVLDSAGQAGGEGG